MMKKSLNKFNPDKVAKIELCMWQAYYKHRFLNLFLLLVRLVHESFNVNYLISIQIAYHAASAAVDFRINKGKENPQRILEKLTRFYQTISSHSVEPFDYKKAAELETQWWFIDRYPDQYKITRQEAIALAMAVVYNTDSGKLSEYASKRAEAMVLQDEIESLKNTKADWNKIESLLKASYRSLYESIQ